VIDVNRQQSARLVPTREGLSDPEDIDGMSRRSRHHERSAEVS